MMSRLLKLFAGTVIAVATLSAAAIDPNWDAQVYRLRATPPAGAGLSFFGLFVGLDPVPDPESAPSLDTSNRFHPAVQHAALGDGSVRILIGLLGDGSVRIGDFEPGLCDGRLLACDGSVRFQFQGREHVLLVRMSGFDKGSWVGFDPNRIPRAKPSSASSSSRAPQEPPS